MAVNIGLMPNESIILQEVNVSHGGVLAGHTDELVLTNLNLICINKGVFGNTKNVFKYPLNQIKMYNGKPQALQGKLTNGTATLDVYFLNGVETFYFDGINRKKINDWIKAITNTITQSGTGENYSSDDSDDSVAGAFKEVGDEFKEVGQELLGAFGINLGKKKMGSQGSDGSGEKVSKKCVSCSAPLTGVKGQVIKCLYCDTEQTL
jgi:hypothetical protein